MQAALNAIYSYGTESNDKYTATINLLNDIENGDAFIVGGKVTLASNSTTKVTMLDADRKTTDLTINLGGYEYKFASYLSSDTAAGNRSVKGFSIYRNGQGSKTSVTINGGVNADDGKTGTISVSNQNSTKFNRIIRSYSDLTLNNVILDGSRTDNGQKTQEDGAILCHTAGTLTLKGKTTILTKNNGESGSNAYFAVSGKLSGSTGTSPKDYYADGFKIIVDTEGEIPNIGLYKWKGTSANFTTQTADLEIKNGTVGEVTYGLQAPTDGTSEISGITTANVKSVVSITGGALGTADSITAAALNTGYFFAPAGGKNYVTNQDGWYGSSGSWNYIAAPTQETATSVGSALATLAGSNKELTLSNANSIAAGIVFNANDTVTFGDITKYSGFIY